ncbi:MAG: discoidin domain-containing protein, partial [Armatimonadota bacterium]|nr:discoidin domain-containing protein [Armatimonadota bacterium]
MRRKLLVALCLVLAASYEPTLAQPAGAVKTTFDTPLTPDNLDPATFAQWVDGTETPVVLKDGPRHVVWTQNAAPEWDGVRFGESKMPGARHLRIGFKAPVAIGSILVRAGGQVSVLKPAATYPGNLADEKQWMPATRLKGGDVSHAEAGGEDYVMWTLPPGTITRALRFTHIAAPTDNTYAGWLGGVFVLSERLANVAPQAVAAASARDEIAAKINNGSNDGTWSAWDNGPEGATVTIAERPERVMLTWPRPVPLRGLNALGAGFGAVEVQAYTGAADKHPREASESDWKTIKSFDNLDSQYPRALGVNWMDFGEAVTTRAIRLRLTKVTREGHPHLNGNTKGGKRVWLGELLALQPLGGADLKTAILPTPPLVAAPHPPIPIRFTLKEAGYVTLVIEGMSGKRVRNLVAETWFPAGENVAWWDGMDDLLRDEEAARHGLYHIPAQFVQPGLYRVRGLYRKAIELRYEFSIYNAGHPPWQTADGTGGWLTNHTPPSSALFVPADKAPGGKPLVYLGSYVSEGGSGLAWVDLNGRKQGGRGWIGGNWTAAPYLARDAGDKPAPDAYAYVGAAWEGELRLTALTPGGDKAVLQPTFKFPGTSDQEKKDNSALGGIAVYNGLLAASLPKQNQLLFVDAALHTQRALVPLSDGRGLSFDAQGRLLALSGTRLLRYTLPAALAPATRLDATGWMATASTHPQDAAKAIDTDANSRWSTNAWQAPGQSFGLDMKTPQTFSRLVLSSSADRDSPHSYEVAVSDDGQNWKTIASGEGTPGVTSIKVPTTTARFFKITQTGTTQNSFWSLNSLELYHVPAGDVGSLTEPQVLTGDLEDPQGITTDAQGNIYVSDRGNSHQVKVFDSVGKLLRTIGHASAPKAGPYDAQHMNNPKGLAIDSDNHLWVAEEDYQPKRVSVWTTDGKFWKAFYGPSEYGGGGVLDPKDKTRFYYHGME